jgi:Fic family protein
MYTPTYTLTPTLLSEITQIERLYGQIEALRIPKQLEVNLTRNNLIQSSYASNKIEGNPLTLPEVTNLLLDDRVPTNRSEKEVVNYFGILKNLPEYVTRPFTPELLLAIHKKLLEGVDKTAGSIRNVPVVVGKYTGETGNVTLKVKHNPPFHTEKEIRAALEEILAWEEAEHVLPAAIRAGIFHHQFVYLHPFEDGNGRLCRIMTVLIFMKAKYEINRYFILDDYYDIDRHLYSDKLHSADMGDKTEWLEYFAEGVKHSLNSALFRVKEAQKTLMVKDRPSPKEADVLKMLEEQPELTSSDLVKKLSISRQQAHNLLSSLVNKGFLEKKGSTKSSFYTMK